MARLYKLIQRLKRPLGTAWIRYLRATGVEIGPEAWVAIGSRIESGSRIGRGTSINGPISVRGGGRAVIGSWCAIGRRVNVITENHLIHLANMQFALQKRIGLDLPPGQRAGFRLRDLAAPADVEVGPACWVGDDVTILAGVTIGAGAVLGAGAIVTRDVAPFAVVAGAPARELRRRCSEEVAGVLLEAAWWEWPLERMRRNRDFFAADIATTPPAQLASLILP